jgi:hypothetical protein
MARTIAAAALTIRDLVADWPLAGPPAAGDFPLTLTRRCEANAILADFRTAANRELTSAAKWMAPARDRGAVFE